MKNAIKQIILLLFPFFTIFQFLEKRTRPFLCIITPIFDPALPSLTLLINKLKKQSYKNFILVCISGGESPKVEKFIKSISNSDSRFIYRSIPFNQSKNWNDILINIGKRRTFVLKNFLADRYMFLDADSTIPDNNYFAKLRSLHFFIKKDILITQTIFPDGTILPIFPVKIARIDITNYIVSNTIAKSYSYPTDVLLEYGPANDFRFFKEINKKDNTVFFPILGVRKNVNPSFKSILDLYRNSIK